MAAPCGKMASRTVVQLLSALTCTTARKMGFRQLGSSSVCRMTLKTKNVLEASCPSAYSLAAGVYLQRLPVVSADCNPIEQKFKDMMLQASRGHPKKMPEPPHLAPFNVEEKWLYSELPRVTEPLTPSLRERSATLRRKLISAACIRDLVLSIELEKSLLSDHELRLIEDAERMRRKQSEDYDSDEEEVTADQDIVLAQDLEDAWEQKYRNFEPAPRVRDDVDKDLTSVQRCLSDSLVLLAEQRVGDQNLWLLPQTQWQEGETLRQTAERALAALPVGLKATFLGNAPCGVYKYKLPKPLRTEGSVGTKIFFFKAVLSGGDSAPSNSGLLWLRRAELQNYLGPAYLMKVKPFILDL